MITVEQVLRHGPATARQLTEALGISQPTLSRRIRELAGAVLILGKGKATRYVLRRGSAVRDSFRCIGLMSGARRTCLPHFARCIPPITVRCAMSAAESGSSMTACHGI